ncbi:MAG: hypothetical protein K1060chlam5_00166 [Candidatus Anoxychlamydiales bacterium]|nr:hypothetical protein [Candidatus Anoxychlamydiales bacterium]
MSICNLLSYLNPFAYFPKTTTQVVDSHREIDLKTWDFEDKKVHLIRHGNKLKSKLICPNRNIYIAPIGLPSNSSIDKAIARIKSLQAFVDANNNVTFDHIYKSKLDSSSYIDTDHWAVTLVDNGKVKKHDPFTWGGHASIIIEKVENNKHIISKVGLAKDGLDIGKINFTEDYHYDSKAIFSKSVTWIRPKHLVEKMISNIEQEKHKSKTQRIPMALRGNGAIGLDDKYHNCFTWARKTLEIAKIHLWKSPSIVSPIIITPKSYIGPNLLTSKEIIWVTIKGSKLKFDITEEIDKIVKGNPWKLAPKANGEPFEEEVISGKIDFRKKDPIIELGTPIIKLIDEKGKILRINAKEIVKKAILDEAFKASVASTAKKVDKFIMGYKYDAIDQDGEKTTENMLALGIMTIGVASVLLGGPQNLIIISGIASSALGIYTKFRSNK